MVREDTTPLPAQVICLRGGTGAAVDVAENK